MKTKLSHTILVAAVLAVALGFAGCGDPPIAGYTYGDSDNSISIEFRYDGKAAVKMLGVDVACTYTEKGNSVTVSCGGAAQSFVKNSDGSLSPADSGLIGKLTRKNK
jgi:uncharacterized lipoprotein YehR (DUF1307 family)